VKAKYTLVKVKKAQRAERSIALFFLQPRRSVGEQVVSATPRPLHPRKRPGTHCTGGWVGPRAGLDELGKSRPPPGFGRPARIQSPCRLSHPGSHHTNVTNPYIKCNRHSTILHAGETWGTGANPTSPFCVHFVHPYHNYRMSCVHHVSSKYLKKKKKAQYTVLDDLGRTQNSPNNPT